MTYSLHDTLPDVRLDPDAEPWCRECDGVGSLHDSVLPCPACDGECIQ